MKISPLSDESSERLWLIILGLVVLAFCFLYSEIGSSFMVEHSIGQWPGIIFILATAALGIYSLVLVYRGRIFLAFIGFVIFALGALFNLPTL
jgi:hypothetical protein